MSRRRSIKFLSAFAAASLIVAACSGDDDDEAITEGTTEETSAGGAPEATTADTEAETTEAEGTEPETTEGESETSAPAGADSVGVEGGSGCGIPHGPYEEPESEPAGEVRVAWNDPLLSFNNRTARGNAAANSNPLYLLGLGGGGGGFWYYDQDLNQINNDSLGTCTIESLDPLTVTYRINEGVTWSDGTQIDAADLLLYWGAKSNLFNDEAAVIAPDGTTAEPDAEGNPVIVDASGTPVTDPAIYDADGDEALDEGYSYKESAGVVFDGVSIGMQGITSFPEISEDGLALTATWDEFFVDYQVDGLLIAVPAHVVAGRALGIDDPAEAKQALIDAFQNDDAAALKPISEFWNTGFDATSLPDDPGLYLSAGPYLLTSYDELSQMTFEINPDYDWGPKPKLATIVYRVIGDPTAAVQAMENEEIDIIQPQATADLLTQLEALADRGVEVEGGYTGTYEHVDLVFDNGGPFDPATYGGDEATALAVRQAFLKTIPRQDIVDRLIVPLNPEATLRDSFTTVPGTPTYEAIASENGSAEYAEVDIEGAQALLEEAGVTEPIDVRFLFAANNPRRTNEYELIRDSAAQVGFNVIDGSSPTWGVDLNTNTLYDASLFGWQSTSVDVAGSESQFATGEQSNYGHYSSEVVDGLFAQLKTSSDADEQQQLLLEIEQNLWGDAFGATIFQHPAVTAWNSTYVDNVSAITLSPTIFWNFWDWEAAS